MSDVIINGYYSSFLRRAALAANQGDWCYGGTVVASDNNYEAKTWNPVAKCVGENALNNAEHIANMSPATVLAMLDMIDGSNK